MIDDRTLVRRYYDKLPRDMFSSFKKKVKETLNIELKTFRKHTGRNIKDFSLEFLVFVYVELDIPKSEIVAEYPPANILLQASTNLLLLTETNQ